MTLLRRIIALACLSVVSAPAQTPLALKQTIDLPGVQGRFDHFAEDDAGHRLFVAAAGNHTVEVLDLPTGKVLESLKGLGKPHGLAWIPSTGRLFVADGDRAELAIYAGSPLYRVKSIPLSDDADDMVFDPAQHLLYVGHGGSDSANPARIAVIDTEALTLLENLPVAAHPEALELDPDTNRIFANIADAGTIAVIDGKTHHITDTWTLHNARGNTPLAFDAADHLLLVAARIPAQLLVLNAATGAELFRAPSAAGADDLFFEPATHRAFLIAGSGTVNVYELDPAGNLRSLSSTPTANGAKTGLLDPAQHLLFLGVPGAPAAIRVYATR